MTYEIMGEYEILGESVDDLLGQDLTEEELEVLGLDEWDDDLLGADLVIGEDEAYDDLVGRRRRRPSRGRRGGRQMFDPTAQVRRQARQMRIKRKQAVQRAAAANIVAQNAAIVSDKVPTKSREFVMGFDSVATVAAGANVQIISRPQVPFRPERLVISGGIAASFLVNDLKVGKNSQLVNSSALPADAFSPTAFGVRLKLDTAQISQDIVLDVTNISAGALRFNAAIFGKAIE